MKTVLTARIEHTDAEIEFQSDGERLYFVSLDGSKKAFGSKFENERDYVNGVLDALKGLTSFKIGFVDQ